VEVTKPWIDDKKYKQDRLMETKYEAELAKRFLEDGLFRNAARRFKLGRLYWQHFQWITYNSFLNTLRERKE